MTIKDYKIGDELFRYVEAAGIFRYVVIGRRERQEEVQLEVECKTCSHGWQCQLLLAQNDYGKVVAEGLQKALRNRIESVRIAQEHLDSAKKRLAEIQALVDGVQP